MHVILKDAFTNEASYERISNSSPCLLDSLGSHTTRVTVSLPSLTTSMAGDAPIHCGE